MECPQCRNDVGYREWIDQRPDAKTYGRVFRRNKCEACGWESKAQLTGKPSQIIPKDQRPQSKPQVKVQTNDKQDGRAFVMSYAKDLVVAMMNNNAEIKKPAIQTIKLFRTLYKEYANPFELKLKEETEIKEIDFNEAI